MAFYPCKGDADSSDNARIYLVKNGIENTNITGGYNKSSSGISISSGDGFLNVTMRSFSGQQRRISFKNSFKNLKEAGIDFIISLKDTAVDSVNGYMPFQVLASPITAYTPGTAAYFSSQLNPRYISVGTEISINGQCTDTTSDEYVSFGYFTEGSDTISVTARIKNIWVKY